MNQPQTTPAKQTTAPPPTIKRNIVAGFVVGSSMSLPGVSGGTMAVMLNVYKEIIHSVSEIFKEPKRSLAFLLPFGFAGCAGLVLLGNIITFLLDKCEAPMMFLFIGAIIGTIPSIFAEAKAKPFRISDILCIAVGFLLMYLFSLIPAGMFDFSHVTSFAMYAILFCGGIFVAIPLVLPGISFTQALFMLGLYARLFTSVKEFDIGFLLPFSFGILAGSFAMAKIMKIALDKKPRQSYMIIGGFVLASILELTAPFAKGLADPLAENALVLPSSGLTWAIYIALLCAGVITTFMIGKLTAGKEAEIEAEVKAEIKT